MIRLILAAILTLAALPAMAQESYTLPATLAQVKVVDGARIVANITTCRNSELPDSCTQAQVDAAGKTGTIYPNTLAGRQAFVRSEWIGPQFISARDRIGAMHRTLMCERFRSGTQAVKDAMCTASGLAAECELCP